MEEGRERGRRERKGKEVKGIKIKEKSDTVKWKPGRKQGEGGEIRLTLDVSVSR